MFIPLFLDLQAQLISMCDFYSLLIVNSRYSDRDKYMFDIFAFSIISKIIRCKYGASIRDMTWIAKNNWLFLQNI